ncbi:MAG: acyltransferase domain-containing protein, partial [Chloroflexi bacterium]|nr:acyltransferase domain-containing protein [Chloroflexota bacterium]
QIPPNVHFHSPNPYIDWEHSPVQVPVAPVVWGTAEKIAGVSSFGISGTNAHVVLAQAPAAAEKVDGPDLVNERPLQLLTLSARDDAALAAYARSYSDFLETHPELDLGDLTYTSHVGRSHFSHRLSVTAASVAELREKLVAVGTDAMGIQRGVVAAQQGTPQIAFLFTGQGSQVVGMGRELYETEPAFRQAIERCAALLDGQMGAPLLEVLGCAPAAENAVISAIDRTENTQPALFALEYALAQLWRRWGIEPDILLGHSVGELAAACVAGVFSLEDGLHLVAARGRLMGALPQEGEMVALQATEWRVREAIVPYAAEVSIAAINGPASVVISGSRDAVLAVSESLAAEGVKSQRLTVSHAFHSPLMEPMLEDFRQVAERIIYHKPVLRLVSNLTGQLAGDEIATPEYWVRHVREAVRFADGVAILHDQGVRVLLEIGPKPVLLGMAGPCLDALAVGSEQRAEGGSGFSAGETAFLPSLRPGQSDWQQLLASLGELYVRGVAVDWEGFDRGDVRRKVALPTYPFQRQRYWVQSRPSRRAAASLRPLIDRMTPLPALQTVLFETEFSVETMPFLADHRVYGEVVSPGAGQIALALHAAQLCLEEGTALKLEDVILPQPLVLPEGQSCSVQALFKAEQAAHTFQLVSLLPTSSETVVLSEKAATHASGRAVAWKTPTEPSASLTALQQRCSQPVDLSLFYTALEMAQVSFGPSFRWLEAAWRSASAAPELLVRLAQPPAVESLQGYLLHPGLLDGCFQAAGLFNTSGETLLPFALESVAVQRAATEGEWWCHVVQRAPDRCDLVLLDVAGSTVAQVTGFQMRTASAAAIRGRAAWQEWLYTVDWQLRPYFGLPPEFLSSPPQAAPGWLAAVLQQVPEQSRQQAAHLQQALEALSLELVVVAFDSAGFHFEPGSVWRSEQIARHLGVIPTYRRLLERLLGMLAEAGIFQPESDGWRVQQRPAPYDPAALLALLRTEYGDTPELRLLARCGPKLSAVLRGTQDALELLFPGGETSDATRLYTETAGAQVMNGLVQAVVQDACGELPAGRGLRILEVGAGTGGTTAGLLPFLPASQSDYLFTDIGASFLHKAAERFASYPFVRYQPLDIEREPAAQGFEPYQADLVVAGNVLYATCDLGQTLAHVRQLLLPGGQLVLLEATERLRWVDLTFGLTDGWWRYADERQGHPLLSAEGWRQQLSAHGFV